MAVDDAIFWGAALVAVVAFLIYVHRLNRAQDHEWHRHSHVGRVRYLDGSYSGILGYCMRRRAPGGWQYRQETESENEDAMLDEQW